MQGKVADLYEVGWVSYHVGCRICEEASRARCWLVAFASTLMELPLYSLDAKEWSREGLSCSKMEFVSYIPQKGDVRAVQLEFVCAEVLLRGSGNDVVQR